MKLKHLAYELLSGPHSRQAAKRLKSLERQLHTPAARLAIPFVFRGSGFFKNIKPMQSQMEFGELYSRIITAQPRTILEIGTCHGGTLYLWCQAAQSDATIISLDLPEGEFGGGYRACRTNLYQSFAKPSQKLHLVRADSHAPATAKNIKSLLNGRKVDFLFIDGDHTYEGVKKDYELYSPLVAPGGLIAVHDIVARANEPRIEVWRFWNEIKQQQPHAQEWIDATPNGRAIGIGLIQINQ